MDQGNLKYNNAKYWQLGFFSLNNAATNFYMALMGYISYYANSVAGFSVVLISLLLTGLNIFDGITDPIAGFFLDKTKGRFGKFRPFMVLGNLLMAISVLLLFAYTHTIVTSWRLPFFIVVYMVYVIGFTFQTVVAKSGQTVLTNNPQQRPVSTYFDSLFIMAAYGGTALFVANYLIPKHNSFKSAELYQEYAIWVILVSGLCTLLAVVGIWEKDCEKYYDLPGKKHKIQVRDYFEIIRGNRPILVLIIAACINKFTATVYGHTVVGVMLFGIMMEDYAISGLIGAVTAIPALLVVTLGIRIAQRMGQKKAFVWFTRVGILLQAVMMVILLQKEINTITFQIEKMNLTSICFIAVFILLNGCKSITNNMVVPMIADCSDYEVYRSGKYVPGLMGALFSFGDKIFVAFGTAFVGLILAAVGYNEGFPQVNDEVTTIIQGTTLFLYCFLPMIGWVISLLAMHYYKLDMNKMKEIQNRLAERKRGIK